MEAAGRSPSRRRSARSWSAAWPEAAALALLLSGCAAATAGRAAALAGDDARLAAQLVAAADARRPDTTLVRRALASSSSYVRASAARVAGQNDMHAMLPTLHALLGDADTAVAASAANAIGLVRDSASVRALAGALGAAPSVALEAAWALGEIGAPARAAIVEALGRPAASRAVELSEQMLIAASRLRPAPIEAIVAHLKPGGDPRVVRAAAYAVARPRLAGGVRALLDHVGSPDDETRAHLARALVRGTLGDSLDDVGFSSLRQLVRDRHPHVRINALRSLGSFGTRADSLLVAGARDDDANVRIAAVQSLATVLADTSARWAALWQADTGFMYRRSLLASAAAAGHPLPAMREWTSAGDWRLRAAVAEAAGGAGWERGAPVLRTLARDSDGRVRRAALGSLAAWADSAARPAAREQLARALADTDFYARAVAIGSLTRRANAAGVPAVLEAWRRGGADAGNDARIAAARYLAAAWRNDSAAFGDTLVAALRALPVSDDPLVRAEVRGITPFAAWPGTEGALREEAWYDRLVATVVAPSLEGRPPMADVVTERGTITIVLFGADAPITVDNFASLARRGYYRGTRFHRVVPNFVAQDGDPEGDGNGGPGYAIRDEFNRRRYGRGAVGMALSGEDTGGSQYFITHSPQPHLDGHYTVFGQVTGGWEALDRLVQGDRILEVRIR